MSKNNDNSKDNIFENLKNLRDINKKNDAYKYLLKQDKSSNEIEKELLSLYYQTDEPYEILYGENLKTYIVEAKIKDIKAIQKEINNQQFDSLFYSSVSENIDDINNQGDIKIYGNILFSISEISNKLFKDDKILKKMFSLLKNKIKILNNLDLISAKGIVSFNKVIKSNNKENKSKYIEIIKTVFKSSPNEEKIKAYSNDFIEGYSYLLKNIDKTITIGFTKSHDNELTNFIEQLLTLDDADIVNIVEIYTQEIKKLLGEYTEKMNTVIEGKFSFFDGTKYKTLRKILENNISTFKEEFKKMVQKINEIFTKIVSDNRAKQGYDNEPYYFLSILSILYYLYKNKIDDLDMGICSKIIGYEIFLQKTEKNIKRFTFAFVFYFEIYDKYKDIALRVQSSTLQLNHNNVNLWISNILSDTNMDWDLFIKEIQKHTTLWDVLANTKNNNKSTFDILIHKLSQKIISLISLIIEDNSEENIKLEYLIKEIVPDFWDNVKDNDNNNTILNFIISNKLKIIQKKYDKHKALKESQIKFLIDITHQEWTDGIIKLVIKYIKAFAISNWKNILSDKDNLDKSLIECYIKANNGSLKLDFDIFGVVFVDIVLEIIKDKENNNLFVFLIIENIKKFLENPDSLKSKLNLDMFTKAFDSKTDILIVNYDIIKKLVLSNLFTENRKLFDKIVSELYSKGTDEVVNNINNFISIIDFVAFIIKNLKIQEKDNDFVKFIQKINNKIDEKKTKKIFNDIIEIIANNKNNITHQPNTTG